MAARPSFCQRQFSVAALSAASAAPLVEKALGVTGDSILYVRRVGLAGWRACIHASMWGVCACS